MTKNKKEQLNNAKVKTKTTLRVWLIAFSIAIITFIVFSQSLKCGFTNYDDEKFIVHNPLVTGKSIEFKKIFTSVVVENDYYPITILSFAFNYQFGKLNPFGYHLCNVLLHVFNTLLVFFFILNITKHNILMALIVALFFGIHPMHVESVTWLTERKDVLFMFFFLFGLLTYLRFKESKKIMLYIVTSILFILSCLSKGTAVVFPAILILTDYLLNKKLDKKIFIEKIPFFLISITFIIITYLIHKNVMEKTLVEQKPIMERLMFASYDFFWYIYKLIIPDNLSVFYPYPKENELPIIYYLAPYLLLCLIVIIYLLFRKDKNILYGILFYFISIVLMLQLIPTGSGDFNMADRYNYLPSIGLLFIVAHLLNLAWQKWKSFRYYVIGLITIAAILFSFQTYSRTKVWQNTETLWTDAINKNPDKCYVGYYNRGNYYQFMINDNEKAFADYKKSIEIEPNMADAHNNLGQLYEKSEHLDSAMKEYTQAIRINPIYELAYFNRASLYFHSKQYELAFADYNKIISMNKTNSDVYADLGLIYLNLHQYNLAYAKFTKAIELNSSIAGYWLNLSQSEFLLGKKNEAIKDATKAQQLGLQIDAVYLNELGIK